MHTDRPLFEAKKIVKRYGRTAALTGVDLTLDKGEFVTVFGANGAGKTTFLRIAASLLQPSEGTIEYRGENIRNAGNLARRQVGFIAHDTFLYKNLTARENLRFYGKLYDIENREDRISENLNAVGLLNRSDDIVQGFSRGMLQRLTIARAFLHDPSLLLLDEPYTGLDSHASEILNRLLGTFYSSERAGIMTTHNIDQGFDIATKVVILYKGKIHFLSPTKEISKQDFKTMYLEVMNRYERR